MLTLAGWMLLDMDELEHTQMLYESTWSGSVAEKMSDFRNLHALFLCDVTNISSWSDALCMLACIFRMHYARQCFHCSGSCTVAIDFCSLFLFDDYCWLAMYIAVAANSTVVALPSFISIVLWMLAQHLQFNPFRTASVLYLSIYFLFSVCFTPPFLIFANLFRALHRALFISFRFISCRCWVDVRAMHS